MEIPKGSGMCCHCRVTVDRNGHHDTSQEGFPKPACFFFSSEWVSFNPFGHISKPKNEDTKDIYKLLMSVLIHLCIETFILLKAQWRKLLPALQNVSHIRRCGSIVFVLLVNEPIQTEHRFEACWLLLLSPSILLQRLALENTVFFEDLLKGNAPVFHPVWPLCVPGLTVYPGALYGGHCCLMKSRGRSPAGGCRVVTPQNTESRTCAVGKTPIHTIDTQYFKL